MRLVGFSIGKARVQAIDGEPVRTGYVKAAAPEPWLITATGAAGDEVAVHADHLYAFDRAAYDHWARELGVPRDAWPDGFFAENLTLDAIDQTALRIGDRFRLGEAELVVTGPRVPCWKLTWRLGQPKPFMRRFRLSGRSGAYFGVLRPGRVRPGDELVPTGGEGGPTVAELSALCDSGTTVGPVQRAVIDRALASPHLSPTVRATLELKVAGLDDVDEPGAWRGWRPFVVDAVQPETADATSFLLRPADGGVLPVSRAGRHIVVRLTAPGAEPVIRTWSRSDHAAAPERYRITVKVRESARGPALLAAAAEGRATVELRAPAGRFHLDRGSFRPVVLVAAGIGITPMVAMARAHLDRQPHVPPLWILHGTPDPASTPFLAELDELAAAHEDVQLHRFHTRGHVVEDPGVHRGRITARRVVEVLRGNYLRVPGGRATIPWFESDMYICGPRAFDEGVRAGLVAAGANPDHVFAEDFSATGVLGAPTRRQDADVDLAGRALRWRATEEPTLLELGESAGLALPADCRAGSCRTCEAVLLEGEVDGPSSVVGAERRVLLCCTYPRSDRVVIAPLE